MSLRSTIVAGIAAAALLAFPAASGIATAAPVGADASNATGWAAVGKWHKGTRYHVGDVVRYKGRAYVALKTTKHRPKNGKRWALIVSKGANGTNGINGTNGAPGATGPTGPTGPVGPNLVLKDKNGTVLGTFVGAGNMGGPIAMPLYWVLFQGGLWAYLPNGEFAWQGSKLISRTAFGFEAPSYKDDQCLGSAYINTEISELASALGPVAGSAMRLVLEGQTQGVPVGYAVAAGAVTETYEGDIYHWTTLNNVRSCVKFDQSAPYSLLPLTAVQLPPSGEAGGLTVSAP